MIAKPEIKSFADLKGKMFAMSLPVDTISIASRLLLAKHGLKEPDYRTTELIGTQTRAKCLTDGECDAVPLGQPDDIVFAAKGFTKLGDSLEVIPVLQFNVIAARRDWAAKNKDVAVRFARAFGDAYRFMRDPDEPRRGRRASSPKRPARRRTSRAQMLAFYYEPDRGVMPRQAEISLPGMAKVIELLGDDRRAQGAAAGGRAVRRSAISEGGGIAVGAHVCIERETDREWRSWRQRTASSLARAWSGSGWRERLPPPAARCWCWKRSRGSASTPPRATAR